LLTILAVGQYRGRSAVAPAENARRRFPAVKRTITPKSLDRFNRGAITEQSNPLLSLVTTKSIGGPYLKVDRSWWPESDAAKSTMLKDGIRSLVEKSLDVTMPLILRVE
jgi:hypothetical protein